MRLIIGLGMRTLSQASKGTNVHLNFHGFTSDGKHIIELSQWYTIPTTNWGYMQETPINGRTFSSIKKW